MNFIPEFHTLIQRFENNKCKIVPCLTILCNGKFLQFVVRCMLICPDVPNLWIWSGILSICKLFCNMGKHIFLYTYLSSSHFWNIWMCFHRHFLKKYSIYLTLQFLCCFHSCYLFSFFSFFSYPLILFYCISHIKKMKDVIFVIKKM